MIFLCYEAGKYALLDRVLSRMISLANGVSWHDELEGPAHSVYKFLKR